MVYVKILNIQTIKTPADVDELKRKVIKEYNQLLCRMSKGYKDDYTFILNQISFIGIGEQLQNCKLLIEYFLNNEQ